MVFGDGIFTSIVMVSEPIGGTSSGVWLNLTEMVRTTYLVRVKVLTIRVDLASHPDFGRLRVVTAKINPNDGHKNHVDFVYEAVEHAGFGV